MAKYLVTGGAGFIGSHLVNALLAQHHQVIVLDDLSVGREINTHPHCRFIKNTILNAEVVQDIFQEIDGCFHLAAIVSVTQSNEEWLATHAVNLTGTINIFDAARRARPHAPVPIVYASSSAVYGNLPTSALNEGLMPSPISAYGADKLGCELHAKVAGIVHQIPTFGLRFFNVYGEGQRSDSPYSGVISIFVDQFKRKQAINIYGDGTQARDFIYVGDVIQHCQRAMQLTSVNAPVVNVCRGKAHTLLDLIAHLTQLTGYQPQIQMLQPRLGDIYYSEGNPALAQQLLGIQANVDLAIGLGKLISNK